MLVSPAGAFETAGDCQKDVDDDDEEDDECDDFQVFFSQSLP
jgi:hypothetical protein